MASDASTDSPLHAKQVVFLFMAATVVAVVVFLCGVLVGRGVPVGGSLGSDTDGLGNRAIGDLPPPTLSTPSSDPSAAARTSDDLTYPRRLGGGMEAPERIGERASAPETQPAITSDDGDEPSADAENVAGTEAAEAEDVGEVVPDTPEASDADGPGGEATPEPSPAVEEAPPPVRTELESPVVPEGAYLVQVIALLEPEPAQAFADRLVERGYSAFVLPPFPDEPVSYYRVRVGPFADETEAERVRARLETEEGLVPYLTR